MPPSLGEVFGMAADPRYAYVDRGTLDDRLTGHLQRKVHVVVHGSSKQGKTWLRERILDHRSSVAVQCQPNATVAGVLEEVLGALGVRATLRQTSERTVGGEIDLTASGELGVKILAKAKAEAHVGASFERATATETAPVGRTPGDLHWVALCIKAAERRVVLEDFHYLPAQVQEEFAFVLKGLLGYGVYFVIVGVWAQGDLLSYYNGDLEGWIEDVHLTWEDADLHEVLDQGCRHLNVRFTSEVADFLVKESRGSVGLLQRMTLAVCDEAGVEKRTLKRHEIDNLELARAARTEVATRMAGRFATFANRFAGHGALHRDVLRAVVAASDDDLLAGIPLADLPQRILASGGKRRTKKALLDALSVVSDVQGELRLSPPVLAWDLTDHRLFVVDQAFLFYRANRTPTWPWEV